MNDHSDLGAKSIEGRGISDNRSSGIDSGEANLSPLQRDEPELYGQMLVADEQIDNAGTNSVWILLFLDVLICMTVHMGWVAKPLGIPVSRLQHWGFYVLCTIFFFIIFAFYVSYAEKSAYRKTREPIQDGLRKMRKNMPWLLAQINHDPALKHLAEQIRSDLTTLE